MKTAEDLRAIFVKSMIHLYENDEMTYEQMEAELLALIEERDKQIIAHAIMIENSTDCFCELTSMDRNGNCRNCGGHIKLGIKKGEK